MSDKKVPERTKPPDPEGKPRGWPDLVLEILRDPKVLFVALAVIVLAYIGLRMAGYDPIAQLWKSKGKTPVPAARQLDSSLSIAITSPTDSIEVTASGESVWFRVSGTSSNVVSDNSLRICVLVHSGTEWHIQRPAFVEPDGRWTLEQAWIGDASAPIRLNSRIRIMAVISRGKHEQDEKVQDPRELNPLAMSSVVAATVRVVR